MSLGPLPEERDLRARSAMELADVATSACKRSFAALAGVSLTFSLPASVVFWLTLAVGTVPAVVVGSVVLAAGLALAHAGCVDVVGDDWFGAKPVATAAVKRTLKRARSVLVLWTAGGAQVVLLLFALIVPGVLAAMALMPAVPAMVLERIGPMASLRRATALSRERRGAHLGALVTALALVVALVLILVQPVIAAAAIGSGRDAPVLVGIAALQLATCVLVVPLFAAVSTAAYIDARVRKEGLDLLFLLSPEAAA